MMASTSSSGTRTWACESRKANRTDPRGVAADRSRPAASADHPQTDAVLLAEADEQASLRAIDRGGRRHDRVALRTCGRRRPSSQPALPLSASLAFGRRLLWAPAAASSFDLCRHDSRSHLSGLSDLLRSLASLLLRDLRSGRRRRRRPQLSAAGAAAGASGFRRGLVVCPRLPELARRLGRLASSSCRGDLRSPSVQRGLRHVIDLGRARSRDRSSVSRETPAMP